MKNNRMAFTMIELVFVIVVIGILSAIAIPKFAVTRNDAMISKGVSTVAAMRSAISMERQKRILKGDFSDITAQYVEENLSTYGWGEKWSRDNNKLIFTLSGTSCTFVVEDNKLTVDEDNCDIDDMKKL